MRPDAALPAVVLPHQPADQELLRRVMEQERIASSLPDPEWSDYLVDLARSALDALPDFLRPLARLLGGLGLSMDTAATVLLAALGAALAALVALVAWRVLRRRRPAAAGAAAAAAFESPPAAPRDRDAWRALLDEHLRAGRLAEALEAVWWWLAASVSRGPVDPSWTSGELLARAGRPDLGAGAAALDRMIYGRRRPDAADVRGVVAFLESAF